MTYIWCFMKIDNSTELAMLAGANAAASVAATLLHWGAFSAGVTGGLALTLSLLSIRSAMTEVTKRNVPQRPLKTSQTPNPGRSPP